MLCSLSCNVCCLLAYFFPYADGVAKLHLRKFDDVVRRPCEIAEFSAMVARVFTWRRKHIIITY